MILYNIETLARISNSGLMAIGIVVVLLALAIIMTRDEQNGASR